MRHRVIHEQPDLRLYLVAFDRDEEVVAGLRRLARERQLRATRVSGVGALGRAVVGYFDRAQLNYRRIRIAEQVELLALTGTITGEPGEPRIHTHVVLGRADGSTTGGHLFEAEVWPSVELSLLESADVVGWRRDEQTGLSVLDLDGGPPPPLIGARW